MDFRAAKTLTPTSTNRALFDLQSSFYDNEIRYMAVEALPVNYYGRPRFSEDLDVAVALEEGKESSLLRIICQPRYRILYPNRAINEDDPDLRSGEDMRRISLVKMKMGHSH